MKLPFFTTSCLLLFFVSNLTLSAQDVDDLIPAAHYTLINTAEDALGLQPPIQLNNTPYAGSEGVYCNGIEPFLPDGSWISTVPIDALNDSVFAVQIEFKITDLDSAIRAVLVCGENSRYLGFVIWNPTSYKIVINNNVYIDVPGILPDMNIWHELMMKYNAGTTNIEYYFDDMKIADFNEALVRDKSDTRIDNYHGGGGWVFKGNMRNLRVFRSETVTSLHDEIQSRDQFLTFPNPATTSIKIEYPARNASTWSITDIRGVTILTGKLQENNNEQDIHFLSPGIYVVQLFDPGGVFIASTEFFKSN